MLGDLVCCIRLLMNVNLFVLFACISGIRSLEPLVSMESGVGVPREYKAHPLSHLFNILVKET